jgi:hypothetical protein
MNDNSEPIYEYVKGQGWVLRPPTPSKTLWVSPCGKFAVAKVNDVPDGAPRTESYSVGLRTLKRCIEILSDACTDQRLVATATYHYVCDEVALYRLKDLPWENG